MLKELDNTQNIFISRSKMVHDANIYVLLAYRYAISYCRCISEVQTMGVIYNIQLQAVINELAKLLLI